MHSRVCISITFSILSSLRSIQYIPQDEAGVNLRVTVMRESFVRVVLRGCKLSVSRKLVGGVECALNSLTKTCVYIA